MRTAQHARWRVPTRRELLQHCVFAAGVSTLGGGNRLAADVARQDFVDAHVHVWTPDTNEYPLASGFQKADMQPPSFTPDELMAHAKPSGVGRVVLVQMSFYGYDNSYMLKTIRDYPGTYAGIAVVDETRSPATTMKELAKQGVRGFRIRPGNQKPDRWLASPGMQAMWKYGADEGLAMCHLIDANYLPSVERMCRQNPRTPVVVDHFARIGVDGTIRTKDVDNLCRLARYDQVSLKISAYYALGRKQAPYDDLGPMIRRVRDAYGAERLMWASDCPYQVQQDHTYQDSIDLIQRLDFLSENDREWILKKTASRLFFS